MDLLPSSYHDSLEELCDEEEESEEIETVFKVVPSVYHQYLDVFSKVKAEKLPAHRACDHHIKLEGSTLYQTKRAPVLFVKKKDGGLRFCVDYHKLNAVTRMNKYPVPPMNQLLKVFNCSSIFYKIDLCGAYSLLRIKKGHEHLTCFRTKYGSFEYFVMPFGLTNAPASFQNLVNDIFQDLLDVYVVVYLDQIMVFSKSEEKHVTHVSTVLSRLRANNLFAKDSKCLFHVPSVKYLDYVVSSEGLKMDQAKVQKILNWQPPRNLKALQPFLGFSNFYRRFIKNYSKKISSLTSFLKNYSCFPLNEEALICFHHGSNPSLPTIVETDASNYALGAVLGQVSDSGKQPIAFNSHKRIPAELNYEIHEKEILGIVWALKHWRSFLLSLSSPFEVLTNQTPLQSFMSSNVLTHCQACWAQFLSEVHLSITYRPGCLATLPDALSRRGDIYLERGRISSNLWQNSKHRSIIQELGKGKSFPDYSFDSSSQLLLFKDRVVVPNDPTIPLSIPQKRHDSPLAGHPGQEKTLKLVKWDFHWSGMPQFIKDYVSSCQQCSRNKNIHHKRF
ncbi:hypothetical protein O181_019889 [Austropuccinia psidii MF-1]|uniref:Reverse transcriptase domain-containing protein n=1 Tax=Austropuccinia psidii MF-1 TaxID=1389203 RepID=A0A9Q3GV68_9BASI|nr:hypothetical protein [Austropuccinia psidii MF-1]